MSICKVVPAGKPASGTKELMKRLAELEPIPGPPGQARGRSGAGCVEPGPGVGEIAVAPLRRCDLQALLAREDWERIRRFGLLDVDGNPDAASLNCTNAIMVIGRALQMDRLGCYAHQLDRGRLMHMLQKERDIRAMFRSLAKARARVPHDARRRRAPQPEAGSAARIAA